jgi:hypothetical protein
MYHTQKFNFPPHRIFRDVGQIIHYCRSRGTCSQEVDARHDIDWGKLELISNLLLLLYMYDINVFFNKIMQITKCLGTSSPGPTVMYDLSHIPENPVGGGKLNFCV